MRAFFLGAVAAVAAMAWCACSGGLQQTPLPGIGSQPAAQPPAASAQPEASDSSDDSSDEPPVSSAKAPASSAKASQAPSKPSRSSAQSARPAQQAAFHAVCPQDGSPSRRQCSSVVRVQPRRSCTRSAPYCASELQSAYGAATAARSRGRGELVAIVDAYGYAGAASDLAVYRKSMGLPACTLASGCLKIVNQNAHASPLPKPNNGSSDDWRAEQAVDVQMVSALCPNCKLLLVQANSDKNSDLAAGVNAAAALGAAAISNSYDGGEGAASDAAYSHAGRAITASAGDDGIPRQPCSFTGVVCVGGTTLTAAPAGGWIERAWHSSGSACSALVAKPVWQRARGCAMRSVADTAALADPSTGVAFFESAGGGWQEAGGTGVAAPIVAALFALEPSAARTNAPAWLWRHGRKAPKFGGT